MVMVNENRPCWHYPAWNLPMHSTNHLQPSSLNSHVFTANAASQGISSLVPDFRTPTPIYCSSPDINLYMNDSQSPLLNVTGRGVMPNSAIGSTGKKFLIFDQSGDRTRLFFSPSFPPQNGLLSRTALGDNGLHNGKLTALVKHESPRKLIIQERLDKNDSNGYGSENHEDTQEIDALLYSDIGDDDSEDNDEVTSTGHSPFPVQQSFYEHAKFGELTEDVASSDGSSKRQKLRDGGYRKSSLKDTASSVHLHRSSRCNDDAESSCVKGTSFKVPNKNHHLHASEKKAKILEMLKILEAVIPGLKSKDPLSVIDEAIDYLKCLRVKANDLGVELTGLHGM